MWKKKKKISILSWKQSSFIHLPRSRLLSSPSLWNVREENKDLSPGKTDELITELWRLIAATAQHASNSSLVYVHYCRFINNRAATRVQRGSDRWLEQRQTACLLVWVSYCLTDREKRERERRCVSRGVSVSANSHTLQCVRVFPWCQFQTIWQ